MKAPVGVLVMAYGGPSRLEDVEAYLLDVRGDRPTTREILSEVVSRYEMIGGGSPILERTRDQAGALQQELDRTGGGFKTFVGMRHWHPFIDETVQQIAELGIERLVGLVMAPHYSRMSIGAYYDKVRIALTAIEDRSIELEAIVSWKDDPGYLDVLEARIVAALDHFPEPERRDVQLIFTAHSLPRRILGWGDPYPQELQTSVERLKERLGAHPVHFAYQSAAMTSDAWLGPDAGDLMLGLIATGMRNFLVIPIGFVCEHVEILYDIDIGYRRQVEAAGGRLERIAMPDADPRMMASLADKVRCAAERRGWL